MTDFLKPDNQLLEDIVTLAKETEVTDPIDWGQLNISEEEAYRMMAAHVLDMPDLDNPIIMRSIIVKLLVENFVLNLKLLDKDNKLS